MIKGDLILAAWALSALALVPLVLGLWLALSARESFAPRLAYSIASRIDRLNLSVGTMLAWAALAMVLIQLAVVILRYVFGIGSVFMQEAILYLNGMMVLGAAGFTLAKDGHVRVDIVYRSASQSAKDWIDLIGAYLLLFPVTIIIGLVSFPYVRQSWMIWEKSRETSGIPAIWALKTFLILLAALLFLQGLAQCLRALMRLTGHAGKE